MCALIIYSLVTVTHLAAAADFEGGLMTSWMTHVDPGVGIVGYPENVERVQIF